MKTKTPKGGTFGIYFMTGFISYTKKTYYSNNQGITSFSFLICGWFY